MEYDKIKQICVYEKNAYLFILTDSIVKIKYIDMLSAQNSLVTSFA